MNTVNIPMWAVRLAARYPTRCYAYYGGIEYHPNKIPGMRICPNCKRGA